MRKGTIYTVYGRVVAVAATHPPPHRLVYG